MRALLNRVPDDIILATGASDLIMQNPKACLCGHFVKYAAQKLAVDAKELATKQREFEKLVEKSPVGKFLGDDVVVPAMDLLPTSEIEAVGALERVFGDEPAICAGVFGGSQYGWNRLFNAVTEAETLPVIEAEFIRRIFKAIG